MHSFHTLPSFIVMSFVSLALPGRAAPYTNTAHTTDRCAFLINAPLFIQSENAVPRPFGDVSGCVCHTTAQPFLLFSHAARAAARSAGTDVAVTALRSLVDAAPGKRTCRYPLNALPDCREEDVCGFICDDGFTLCGGECKPAGTCAPAEPLPEDSRCAAGYIACPTDDEEASFLCVDPLSDPEHCGGCSAHSALLPTPFGQDCSAIRGSTGASCRRGSCVVDHCRAGWDVAPSRDTCVRRYNLKAGAIRLGKRP